jgi:hypothetical protein
MLTSMLCRESERSRYVWGWPSDCTTNTIQNPYEQLDNPSNIRILESMAAPTPIPPPSGEPPEAFRPGEAQASALIDALCSPSLSVQQVAAQFSTSVGALCLYITSPRGSESLATLDAALTTRLRLIALAALPAAAASLSAIVQDHAAHETALAASRGPGQPATSLDAANLDDLKVLERCRVNARKVCALLYRLATHHPRAPRSPSDHRASPLRDSAAAPAHHAASAPEAPPAPASASNLSTPRAAAHAAATASNHLEPLDPLDRIESLSGFSIPRELRSRIPLATQMASLVRRADVPSSCDMLTHPLVPQTTHNDEPAPVPPVGRPSGATGARSLVALAGSTTPINVAALNGSTHPVSSCEPPPQPSPATVRPSPAAAHADLPSAPRGDRPSKSASNHRSSNGSATRAHTPASLTSGP